MARWLLVRHGETEWNAAGRLQGQADPPLSAAGRGQATALAGRLADEPLAAILSSDLSRALETARILARGSRRPPLMVQVEPALRELSFGAWEGLTYAELAGRNEPLLAAWQADPQTVAPPGGESLGQMARRVAAFYTWMKALPGDHTRLVVAHGGPLQVLLCLALGLPVERYWQLRLEPGSLSELNLYPEGAILNRLNSTGHLRPAPAGVAEAPEKPEEKDYSAWEN